MIASEYMLRVLIKVKNEEVHNPERCMLFIHGGAKRIVLEVRNAIILDRK